MRRFSLSRLALQPVTVAQKQMSGLLVAGRNLLNVTTSTLTKSVSLVQSAMALIVSFSVFYM